MLPISYEADPDAAVRELLNVISSMKSSNIVFAQDDYIHCEFATTLLGFVDDVEFLIDRKESVIHFRSASHIGHYDFQVNRERMDEISERFQRSSMAVKSENKPNRQ